MINKMEKGYLVKAVYDFQTNLEGELSIQVGQIIHVMNRIDKHWLQGISSGQQGSFPSSFVMEIKVSPISLNEKLFAATDKFSAQEDGDLSFERGDIIVGKRPIDANWWFGEINNRQGIFPLTHVWAIDTSNLKMEDMPKKVNLKARVKMDMVAQLPEEVDLIKGDIITVTEFIDKDWYRGISNDKVGIFPSSFVILLDEKTSLESSNSLLSDQKIEEKSSSMKNGYNSSLLETSDSTDLNNQFGYDCTNSGITPYGRTRSSFSAEYPNELSFSQGELITLRNYIDDQWMEGEIDGRVGLFPSSYVDIIVDLDNNNKKQSNNNQLSNKQDYDFPSDTYGRVLYDYEPQIIGDLRLKVGDTVTLLRAPNSNWFEAMTDDGTIGMCPANFIEVIECEPSLSLQNTSQPNQFSTNFSDWNKSQKSKPERPPPPYSSVISWNQNDSFQMQNHSSSKSINDSIASNISNLELSSSNIRPQTLPRYNSASKISVDHADLISYNSYKDNTFSTERSLDNLLNYEEAISQTRPLTNFKSNCSQSQTTTYTNETATQNTAQISNLQNEEIPEHSNLQSQRIPHRPAPSFPISRQPINRLSSVENEDLNGDNVDNIQNRLSEKENQLHRLEKCKKKLEDEINNEQCEIDGNISVRNELKDQINIYNDEIDGLKKEIKILQYDIHPKIKKHSLGIDMMALFGNLDEVIDIASKLLHHLEDTMKQDEVNQLIGQCFIDLADDLKEVYGHYCRNHDDIHSLLDKYEENQPMSNYLKHGVEIIQRQTNCFDLRSILIKPVQRILKYPLLLNELVKCTEDSHLDKKLLSKAVDLMTDVATAINEFKRRKDLVFKYRKSADTSLSTRISKFTIHSILKKSSRFGMRLSSSIGLTTVTKDEMFEDAEKTFRSLEKTIKIFLKDVNSFNESMQDYRMTALNVAEDIANFYQQRNAQQEIEKLRTTHFIIVTQYWEDFKISMERHVINPLNELLQTFNGPRNLIQKRYDKLLDYEACTNRLERNKDVTKQKTLCEEQQLMKNTYEALNSQLLDELPKLCELSTEILNFSVIAFLQLRKTFLGRVAKQMIELTELPLIIGNRTEFLETFQVKHNLASAKLSDFSSEIRQIFASNSSLLKTDTLTKKTDTLTKKTSPTAHRLSLGSSPLNTQTESQRTYLKSHYSSNSLYIVRDSYVATDILDLSVQKDDIVRIIKKQDPMGNSRRWFVDNGSKYFMILIFYNANNLSLLFIYFYFITFYSSIHNQNPIY
ncbi:dynamin-binding protein-like [Centruroides sculpturatus]|uniref:dynamin-binding protein-like n=1 Tax=Centruroides sculpturatus TaxID=218467 RepID=UPI000C6CA37F|nr:dynamin-binding protein-like [Centruroides sculpturatus]